MTTLDQILEARRRNMRALYERLNGDPPDDNPKGIPMTDFDTGPARQAADFLSTLDDAEVAAFVQAAHDQVGTRELVRNLFAPDRDDAGLAGLVPRGGKEAK